MIGADFQEIKSSTYFPIYFYLIIKTFIVQHFTNYKGIKLVKMFYKKKNDKIKCSSHPDDSNSKIELLNLAHKLAKTIPESVEKMIQDYEIMNRKNDDSKIP